MGSLEIKITSYFCMLVLFSACANKHIIPCERNLDSRFTSYVIIPAKSPKNITIEIYSKDDIGEDVAEGALVVAGETTLGCLIEAPYLLLFPPVLAICTGIGAIGGGIEGAVDSHVYTSLEDPSEAVEQLITNYGLNSNVASKVFAKAGETGPMDLVMAVDPEIYSFSAKNYAGKEAIILIDTIPPYLSGWHSLEKPIKLSINYVVSISLWSDDHSNRCLPQRSYQCDAGQKPLDEWSDNNYFFLKEALAECTEDISQKIFDDYFLTTIENQRQDGIQINSLKTAKTPVDKTKSTGLHKFKNGDVVVVEFKNGNTRKITITNINDKFLVGYYDFELGHYQVSNSWDTRSIKSMTYVAK